MNFFLIKFTTVRIEEIYNEKKKKYRCTIVRFVLC